MAARCHHFEAACGMGAGGAEPRRAGGGVFEVRADEGCVPSDEVPTGWQHDIRELERAEELVGDGARPLDGERLSALSTREVGALGEFLAACYLRERGYEIIERNYRCAEGEADLVAFDLDADDVVLVEVKTRRRRREGADAYPEEAVTPRKQRRYRRIASCYVMEHYPVPHIRFDTVGVTLVGGAVAQIAHACGAFDWDAEL